MVRKDRPLARDCDGNGARIYADLGAAVDYGEEHGRSLSMTGEATSCGFSRVGARMGFHVAAAKANFRRTLLIPPLTSATLGTSMLAKNSRAPLDFLR